MIFVGFVVKVGVGVVVGRVKAAGTLCYINTIFHKTIYVAIQISTKQVYPHVSYKVCHSWQRRFLCKKIQKILTYFKKEELNGS